MPRAAFRATAILLPGFGGSARQPILLALSKRLEPLGLRCVRFAPKKGRPSKGLEAEVAQLAKVRAKARPPHVLIGRSFGGRVCARLSVTAPPLALVLLGFPIRPPKTPRPDDEAALAQVRCPTLVVQGGDDELGPLRVLRGVTKGNPAVRLAVIPECGHSFGRQEPSALDQAAAWLDATVPR